MAAKKTAQGSKAAPASAPKKPKPQAKPTTARVKAHAVVPKAEAPKKAEPKVEAKPEVTLDDLLKDAKALGDKIRAFDLSQVETRTRFGLIAVESAEDNLNHPTGPN